MARLLFICTGNQCRSPMAAFFAVQALAGRELGTESDPVAEVIVLTAGTQAPTGRPVAPATAKVMTRRGFDTSVHRSSTLPARLMPEPDLIIGMTREHARSVVEAAPGFFPRTFTLKDFVRRASATGPRAPGEGLPAYLSRMGEDRSISSLAGWSSGDDIADPIGQPRSRHERCADEIESLVVILVAHLWPARA